MEYQILYPERIPYKVTTELRTAIKNALLCSIVPSSEQLPNIGTPDLGWIELLNDINLNPDSSLIQVTDPINGIRYAKETHRARISGSLSNTNFPFPIEVEFVRVLEYKDDYSKDLLKPFSLFVKYSDGTCIEIGMIGDNPESAMSRGTHTFREIFTQGIDLYNLLVKPDRKLPIYSSDPREDGKFKSGIKKVKSK